VRTEEAWPGGRTAARPEYAPRALDATPLSLAAWFAATLVRWRIIAATVAAMLAVAALALVFVSPVYRTRASFVANGPGGLKLPGSLGSGAGLLGIASQLGISPTSDPSESPAFYAQLIESRELRTRLVESRFADPRTGAPGDSATLIDLLDPRASDPQRRLELAIKQVDGDVEASFDIKTNLVRLTVDAEWPELSAAVANRVVSLVNAFNLEQRLTRARSKREFVEGRLAEAQQELRDAETRLRVFYEQNRQWRSSPALTYAEGQLSRQVDVAADMYMTLRREFESARISEVNDTPVITVVDAAVPPRRPLWPRYAVAFVAACLVGSVLGFVLAALDALRADWAAKHPDDAAELRLARRTLVGDFRAAFRLRAPYRGDGVGAGHR
jgi:uncharacterized protein involved in exopolysaccharide biosynthesis